jgi:hypothetical protein
MYEDTPNKEEIGWFEEEIQVEYQYEKMKDCDLEFLRRKDPDLKVKVLMFKSSFPGQDSGMQGTTRAWALDNPNETKEALTNSEQRQSRDGITPGDRAS